MGKLFPAACPPIRTPWVKTIDPLHPTSQCYVSSFGRQNITLERTCLCKTDWIYEKRYLILKMNYKIHMHLIDFKIAHINVQALVYLVLFQK